MEYTDRVTLINEIANSITHGIGALLAVAALVLLVVFASIHGDAEHIVSFSIYGSTLVILYLASTLYHSIQKPRLKYIMRIIDHSAIYLLIAGTYTPFTLVTLQGTSGWVMFGVIWGLALTGILYKTFFINRHIVVSTLFYLLMGWMIVFSIGDLLQALPLNGVILLAAGGLAYTLGMVFYAMSERLLMHAIWHLFVLGGSICHFFSILFYVLPLR
ncbi:MAG TPA: hemolysin III family protein [Candidatus Limnocylindrales bacterium]|nr:hemolysin III family protein [Candidatus Limnocylindrales bacterium]